MKKIYILFLMATLCAICSCGSKDEIDDYDDGEITVVGVWKYTEPGVDETEFNQHLKLTNDGSYILVEWDPPYGSWSEDGKYFVNGSTLIFQYYIDDTWTKTTETYKILSLTRKQMLLQYVYDGHDGDIKLWNRVQ